VKMFGGRLIPSALIGVGLAAVLFIIGGIAEKLGVLIPSVSGTTGPLMALLGFTIPIGIGLYEDYKEGKAASGTTAKPQ
jgi:hypothetical protein